MSDIVGTECTPLVSPCPNRDWQFEAKELADYIFDGTAAILLLERAQKSLERKVDAKEAHVAD